MKRIREAPEANNTKPTLEKEDKEEVEEPSIDDSEDEFLSVMIVPLNYKHKYVHFTYNWMETTSSEDPGTCSALIDITGMSVSDRDSLLNLLEGDETAAKICVLMVSEGDDGIEHKLSKEERALLRASRWCRIPPANEGFDESKIVQIVSFVSVDGCY